MMSRIIAMAVGYVMVTCAAFSAAHSAEIVQFTFTGPCYYNALAFAKKHSLYLVEVRRVGRPGAVPPPCSVAPCLNLVSFTSASGDGVFQLFQQLDDNESRCLTDRIEITTPPTAPLRRLPEPPYKAGMIEP